MNAPVSSKHRSDRRWWGVETAVAVGCALAWFIGVGGAFVRTHPVGLVVLCALLLAGILGERRSSWRAMMHRQRSASTG